MEKHEWTKQFGLTICKKCNIVKRKDGIENKPCKGRVKITTRKPN